MSLSAAVIDALVASGVTVEQLAAAMKAGLAEQDAKKAAKREGNAERQRRFKARKAIRVTPGNGDNALPSVTPSPNDIYSNPQPEPVEPNGSTPPCRFSVEDAVAAWNETAGRCGLNKAKTISPDRRKAISARLKATGEEGWREALAGVERSKFCRGENDRGFRADLDFVAQPKSFNRLREGFYGTDADEPGKVVQLDPTARADTMERTALIYDKQGRDREAAQIRQEAARLRKTVSIGSVPESATQSVRMTQ